MNFVFWLIVIVILAGMWVTLCYCFPILGKKILHIKDAIKFNMEQKEK